MERRPRTPIEHASLTVASFVVDEDGTILQASPTLARLSGSDSLVTFLFDGDPEAWQSWAETLIGEPGSTVCDVPGADGQHHMLEVTAWRNDDRIEGTLADVTALRDIQGRYLALVERTPVPIVIIQDDVVVYANSAQEALVPSMGRRATDVVLEAMHPEDRELVVERIRQREAGADVPTNYRYRQLSESGVRWMEVWSYRVEFKGRPAVQALSRDVTQIVLAEEAVRRNEERLRVLAEHSSDVLMLVSTEGAVEYVSPAVNLVLDRAAVGIMGSDWLDIAHDEDRAQLVQAVDRMLSSPGVPVGFSYRARHGDGSWRRLTGVGTNLIDNPAVKAVVINQHDITAEESALARLESLLAVAPDAMLMVDLEGRVMSANGRARELFGTDVTIQPVATLLPTMAGLWDDLLKSGSYSSWKGTVRHSGVREPGVSFPAEVSARITPDARGQMVFIAVRDLTELRDLEDKFHHAQKLEAVGRLAGGIAHDFNNLLTVIGAAADLALDQNPDESVRTELEHIVAARERAAQLSTRLLTFSRQHKQPVRVTDLNVLVDGVQGMLRRVVREDVQLRTILAGGPLPVLADPGQLEQVITNLVVNARDAMPSGGALTVETTIVELGERDVVGRASAEPGSYVVLEVRDTGTGMASETLDRAFEPFYTTKGVGEGTGLGLSTVLGIVEQAGGFVTIDSTPGVGTRVRSHLPLTSAESQPSPETPTTATASPLHASILVVEDDPLVRSIAERGLVRLGASVTTATNAAEALTLIDDGRSYDLILSDVVMPGINGFELRGQIHERSPGTPVVLMTGHATRELADGEQTEDGPLLHKPFTLKTLQATIEPLLEIAGGPDAAREQATE